MDAEVLNIIKAKLLEVKELVELSIIYLDDVDTIESSTTGKFIAIGFDDGDLTNVQISVDDASTRLQDLSTEIAELLE